MPIAPYSRSSTAIAHPSCSTIESVPMDIVLDFFPTQKLESKCNDSLIQPTVTNSNRPRGKLTSCTSRTHTTNSKIGHHSLSKVGGNGNWGSGRRRGERDGIWTLEAPNRDFVDRIGRLNSLPIGRELARYPDIRNTHASASMKHECSTINQRNSNQEKVITGE